MWPSNNSNLPTTWTTFAISSNLMFLLRINIGNNQAHQGNPYITKLDQAYPQRNQVIDQMY